MTFEGVEVLNHAIIYSMNSFGIIIIIALLIIGAFLMFWGVKTNRSILLPIGFLIIFIAFFICAISSYVKTPNAFNKPNKIQFAVEIKDDNAWKEIGPKYVIKEKLFDNKEIYLIEGDYTNDNP